jgi:hypothetical protein
MQRQIDHGIDGIITDELVATFKTLKKSVE